MDYLKPKHVSDRRNDSFLSVNIALKVNFKITMIFPDTLPTI